MSKWCSGAFAEIRKIDNAITPVLEKIIETTTTFTGEIKALELNPTVEAIIKLIPDGSEIEGWANTAMDMIVKVEGEVNAVSNKISAWLNGKTSLETNVDLLKLSSVMTSVAHAASGETPLKESLYDSAIQIHIMQTKVAAAK